MYMSWIDWSMVGILLFIMVAVVIVSKTLMRSVADFLAAGRTAGRYIISVSVGMAGLGAITMVGNLEMNYVAALPMTWWGFVMMPVMVIVQVTGWVVYRYRQTRALTMAQFFEMRYSRRFRIFAGILSFFSGLINFGIFPAVGARFFIYFCGIPHEFIILGLTIPTFPIAMAALLSISLFFVFAGGQVAVIITDFVQGVFVNLVFVILIFFFLKTFTWDQISGALMSAPKDQSLINPFDTSQVQHFNLKYFLIGVITNIYVVYSWQGTQGYNASAKSAHEAKMAGVLSNWRGYPQVFLLLIMPIVAYTIMHHVDFSSVAANVNGVLDSTGSNTMKGQLTVPLAIQSFLPVGIFGAFVAVMLAAFISTHDTYLHSWGTIFIQDVIVPFRKKEITPEQRLKLLRYSITGVAIFIFFFSMFFTQSQYINLFFAITAAIFVGGSGTVIIGGLYWKRGSTPAAWAALITGAVVSIGGIILQQIFEDFFIDGQEFYFLAMVSSVSMYVLISLFGPKSVTNMDKLLNRGKYRKKDEYKEISKTPQKGWKLLGMGKEFTRGDKFIYILTYVFGALWMIIFIWGTIINLTGDVSNQSWSKFWQIYLWIGVVISGIVTIWFAIGGWKDVKFMLNKLKTMIRDKNDDGSVTEIFRNGK